MSQMGYNLTKRIMKKLLLILALVLTTTVNAENYQIKSVEKNETNRCVLMNLVFRGTQKLRCNSTGNEIYMYTNSSFKCFDSYGKLVAEGTYNYDASNKEVYVYELDGTLVYKCKVTVNSAQQCTCITFAGDNYYRF